MADEDPLVKILEDLLMEEDILATMLARKGFEGVEPSPEKFKLKDATVWNTLQETMADMFDIISRFAEIGLDKIYFELGDYEVVFFVLPGKDTALVAIIPALANKGLLEVEIENTRRAILKVLGG